MPELSKLKEHLMARYIVSGSGCWEYQRCSKRDKYGLIEIEGRLHRAHRVSYSLFNGKIPDGMMVLHRCDNPPCINPKHLFVGNNSDNMADKISKGRQSKGEGRPLSKFKDKDVRQIRSLVEHFSLKYIAIIFDVNPSTISRIVAKKTWKHIGG